MIQSKGIQKQSGHRGQVIDQVRHQQQQRHLSKQGTDALYITDFDDRGGLFWTLLFFACFEKKNDNLRLYFHQKIN